MLQSRALAKALGQCMVPDQEGRSIIQQHTIEPKVY